MSVHFDLNQNVKTLSAAPASDGELMLLEQRRVGGFKAPGAGPVAHSSVMILSCPVGHFPALFLSAGSGELRLVNFETPRLL